MLFIFILSYFIFILPGEQTYYTDIFSFIYVLIWTVEKSLRSVVTSLTLNRWALFECRLLYAKYAKQDEDQRNKMMHIELWKN